VKYHYQQKYSNILLLLWLGDMIVFGSCDSTSTSTLTTTSLTPESSAKMGDLEDLNRTLYDIGAQDLLDVWDAMETEVSLPIPLLK